MDKFTLNQLRADVLDHIDLPISILNGSSFWRDQWIDWILIQMIGKDYFDLLLQPGSMICFSSNLGQYMCMYHNLTK
jgi:hypothetical protein